MSRLLVVQNGPDGGPGRFGDWLASDGPALDVVHAYAGAPLPRRLAHEGVMVLGGGYLPDDDVRAPWLAPTRALVAEAVERGVPVFGICLGGQLLAHVAGGTVRADHGEPEFGSTPLTLRAETGSDPLFRGPPERGDGGRAPCGRRHRPAAGAPPGWWRASGARTRRSGSATGRGGMQFHPEAGADRVRSWAPERIRAKGLDPAELSRRAERDETAAEVVWREVARRFAAVVGT
ncbi:type 1 glutamine amidotransferase [Streptomyces thinghirensis]|nr:type 1 glutamine amidotransferase [Streptomyces thinghirensis]